MHTHFQSFLFDWLSWGWGQLNSEQWTVFLACIALGVGRMKEKFTEKLKQIVQFECIVIMAVKSVEYISEKDLSNLKHKCAVLSRWATIVNSKRMKTKHTLSAINFFPIVWENPYVFSFNKNRLIRWRHYRLQNLRFNNNRRPTCRNIELFIESNT